MRRNKFFWIGFIYFLVMLLMYSLARLSTLDPTFSFDPIFYVIPVTFMLGGIITWKQVYRPAKTTSGFVQVGDKVLLRRWEGFPENKEGGNK